MKLNTLKSSEGSRQNSKRLGRGIGSGTGKTSGKGHKGQNSRSGGGTRPGFEGGQNPIFRRLPKRGFTNHNYKYAVVNVVDLNIFENDTVVTPALLIESGLIQKNAYLVKILGIGGLEKKLNVHAHKFSKTAHEAIIKAGGQIEELGQ